MPSTTKPLADLLNKVDAPARVMGFAWPSRIIRVTTTDESYRTFRVEQLILTKNDPHNPRGTWNTLSTHGSERPGESYPVALEAACKAQSDLRAKLLKRRAERQAVPA